MDTIDLKDKVALVTGGARGIGKDIALRLAGCGANIAVVDLELDVASAAAKELSSKGIESRAYRCDVSSFEDVETTSDAVLGDFGQVDIVINNAGITRDKLIMRMTPADWNAVINVNLTGTFNVCKVLGTQLLKLRAGSIVNIASVVGQMGNAGQVNYAASKAGVIGLTKTLAKEFATRNVRVNAVAPGFINTVMTESLSDGVREAMMNTIPMRRFGDTADVAAVVMFLVSDLASYVTGQVINCDGGMIMAR